MKRVSVRVYTNARLSGIRDDEVAGNKKKRQYHRPPAQKAGIIRPVRLSQCMIVKNEEKNIERALSWAKGHAFEQIVVDTGSTDRTVEIAESMGAKVYHFEWINDFSAAKNYAISFCTGNWIALLDADEWVPECDMPKLMEMLKLFTNDSEYKRYNIIRTSLVNVNDEGKPFHTMTQNRFIRNNCGIEYVGAIHEMLTSRQKAPELIEATEITILHSGYSQSVYKETDKLDRNIEMIRREVKQHPENLEMKAYLADSLDVRPDEESKNESLELYREVADSDIIVHSMLGRNAFMKVIANFIVEGDLHNAEKYVRRAIERLPEYMDFYALKNEILYKTERYTEAWESIRTCEKLFEQYGATQPNGLIEKPVKLFTAMYLTAVQLNDAQNAVKYATLALKEDKMQAGTLGPLLMALKHFGNATDNEIFGFLEGLYDFNEMRDKVFLARVANSVELLDIRDRIMERITPEERAYMAAPE